MSEQDIERATRSIAASLSHGERKGLVRKAGKSGRHVLWQLTDAGTAHVERMLEDHKKSAASHLKADG